MINEVKLLDCKQEIMNYLKCSEHKLLKYINMGMPVYRDNGMWLAHQDNFDFFFREITWPNKSQKRIYNINKMMTNEIKLLDCKQAIMDCLKCSEHILMKYIKIGLPVYRENGMWLAHPGNIDFFFWEKTWPEKTPKRRTYKTPVK